MFGNEFVQPILEFEDPFSADFDVRGLPLGAAHDLVDHDLGVGKNKPFPLSAGSQQDGRHGGRHADANGLHVGLDVLHGVVDGQTRSH